MAGSINAISNGSTAAAESAPSQNGTSSAVTSTGSGFQAIVPSELSIPCVSSRPQISHTHGS